MPRTSETDPNHAGGQEPPIGSKWLQDWWKTRAETGSRDKSALQLNETVPVKDWWETCHVDADQLWLTGSQGPEVWEYLGVESWLQPGTVVLNIGVGMGHCTRALAARGCAVQALDIAQAALDRVADVVTRGWLASELEAIPEETIEVAISNLVAQHVNDRDLLAQMRAVIRSLKQDGVFAMQFAYAEMEEANDLKDRPASFSKGGGECRSLAGVEALIKQARGRIVWAQRIGRFPAFGCGWYGLHIVKDGYPFVHSSLKVREGMALRALAEPALTEGAAATEAFLCEVDEAGVWAEVLLAYFESFPPGGPIRLLLLLDAGRESCPTLEEAEAAVLQVSVLTRHFQFPDVQVLANPTALLDVLRSGARIQRLDLSRPGVPLSLSGEAGRRLSEAVQRIRSAAQ